MSVDTDKCPAGAVLAQKERLLAVTHGERTTAGFATPDTEAAIYKVVRSAVPLHTLRVGLHAPIKPKGGNGDWTVNDVF